MGNQEWTTHKHNITQKTKKKSNTDHTKILGVKASASEGLAVHASYLTPAVVLIYIVKFVNSCVGDRGKV